MSGYLARLKTENPLPCELTKPTKAPFVSSVSTGGRHLSENSPLQPGGIAAEGELFDMIRQAYKGLDAAGSWEGFRQRLTPEDRQRIKSIEGLIDLSYGERNAENLTAALSDLQMACLQVRVKLTETEV